MAACLFCMVLAALRLTSYAVRQEVPKRPSFPPQAGAEADDASGTHGGHDERDSPPATAQQHVRQAPRYPQPYAPGRQEQEDVHMAVRARPSSSLCLGLSRFRAVPWVADDCTVFSDRSFDPWIFANPTVVCPGAQQYRKWHQARLLLCLHICRSARRQAATLPVQHLALAIMTHQSTVSHRLWLLRCRTHRRSRSARHRSRRATRSRAGRRCSAAMQTNFSTAASGGSGISTDDRVGQVRVYGE